MEEQMDLTEGKRRVTVTYGSGDDAQAVSGYLARNEEGRPVLLHNARSKQGRELEDHRISSVTASRKGRKGRDTFWTKPSPVRAQDTLDMGKLSGWVEGLKYGGDQSWK